MDTLVNVYGQGSMESHRQNKADRHEWRAHSTVKCSVLVTDATITAFVLDMHHARTRLETKRFT